MKGYMAIDFGNLSLSRTKVRNTIHAWMMGAGSCGNAMKVAVT
jgi:hypothetical protein